MNSSHSDQQPPLVGATCDTVPAAECSQWLQWILGQAPAPARTTTSRWLLAHCDDGVTWGVREGEGWKLGSAVFPKLSPHISIENLIELRLFGGHEELLLWRDDSELRGRWLRDHAEESLPAEVAPARPYSEDRILIGNNLKSCQRGFSLVSDGTGREQAVPLECQQSDFGDGQQNAMPLRLTVRHFFEIQPTGAVRVAASRLVQVKKDNHKGGRS